MSDLRARLLEAAVRPLSDNAELKHAAADFLDQRMTENINAAAMLKRWDEVDARKQKSFWSVGLWIVVGVVSMGVVSSDLAEISRLGAWGKWLSAGSIFAPLPDVTQRVADKLNDAEKRLLLGDLTKRTKCERKKGLWLSDPENPAYFADYAGAFISEHEKLPPDYLEIIRRIDPTNAWFTYLAAATEGRNSVKGKSRKSKRIDGKFVYLSAREWEVLDTARLDRALALLREARGQLKYESYGMEMLRKRLPLLPQGTTLEKLDSSSVLGEISVFSSMQLRTLVDAIYAKAWSLGESGDLQGFQEISSDAELFLHRSCNTDSGVLIDGLMSVVIATSISECLGYAAEKLGLADDATRWKAISKRLADRKDGRETRRFIVDGKAVQSGTRASGLLGGSIEMVARQVEKQPVLTDADIQPLRLVEHEFLSRVFSYISWGMMAICIILVASYRFYGAALSRRMAIRMLDLLRPSDWAWIVVAGLVLPFVFVMTVNRLTPLGGRELSIQGTGLLMPASHFLGLILLWLIVPVQLVRWRLAKRVGGLGFTGATWHGCLAIACVTAYIPLIGWAAISGIGGFTLDMQNVSRWPWQLWVALSLIGLSTTWLVVVISIAVLGRADRQLYRITTSLVLTRTYTVTLAMIALAALGFKVSEHYWFKQDRISKFDLSAPGWTVYESRVAAQMRRELREIIGDER